MVVFVADYENRKCFRVDRLFDRFDPLSVPTCVHANLDYY